MDRFREQTCCFFGEDDIPLCDEAKLRARIRFIVEPLVKRGVRYFGIGGASVFDLLAGEFLLDLQRNPLVHISVISVLPWPGWLDGWEEVRRAREERVVRFSDKVVYTAPGYYIGLETEHIRKLADGSGHCVCYCRQKEGRAADAVRYAFCSGLKVYNAGVWNIRQLMTQDNLAAAPERARGVFRI